MALVATLHAIKVLGSSNTCPDEHAFLVELKKPIEQSTDEDG